MVTKRRNDQENMKLLNIDKKINFRINSKRIIKITENSSQKKLNKTSIKNKKFIKEYNTYFKTVRKNCLMKSFKDLLKRYTSPMFKRFADPEFNIFLPILSTKSIPEKQYK